MARADVTAEPLGSGGRSGIRLAIDGRLWVFEFKVARDCGFKTAARSALDRILKEGDAATCPGSISVGVAIDGAKRKLAAWKSSPTLPEQEDSGGGD
jgi:hypothetical protein